MLERVEPFREMGTGAKGKVGEKITKDNFLHNSSRSSYRIDVILPSRFSGAFVMDSTPTPNSASSLCQGEHRKLDGLLSS